MDVRRAYDDLPTDGSAVRFAHLWRLGPSEVVSLVGAGGKSSLIEAIARDYEAEGTRVVITTTTKMRRPTARPLVVAEGLGALTQAVSEALAASRPSPIVGRALTSEGKVEGVPSEWVSALRDVPGVAAVLVEADGSAGLPLKAPAEWEPVVPACSSLVVSVAGLDAQGALLDERHVHRPRLLADRLGVVVGSRIAPRDLLRAATGYESAAPAQAGFIVFLNKADSRAPDSDLLEAAAGSEWEVWCGSAAPAAPDGTSTGIPEASEGRHLRRIDGGTEAPAGTRMPAVVLAAGLGARMAGPKVSAAFGDASVVGYVVRAAVGCGGFDEVVVVAGPDAEAVTVAVRAEERQSGVGARWTTPVRVVRNPVPEEGMASSLRVGMGALRRPAGAMILLGDQPLVRPETLTRLLAAAASSPRAAAVGACVGDAALPRPPVLLHRSLLPRALESVGDEGARRLIATHAESAVCLPVDADEMIDVDRPEDLERARSVLAGREGRPLH